MVKYILISTKNHTYIHSNANFNLVTPGSNHLHNGSGNEVVRCYWHSGFYVDFFYWLKISGSHTLMSRGQHVGCPGSIWTDTLLVRLKQYVSWVMLCMNSRIITRVALEWLGVEVFVANVCHKAWRTGAGHITEEARVVVHMVTYMVCQQSLTGETLATVWTLVPLHYNSSHQYIWDNVPQFVSLELVRSIKQTATLIYTHTSALKHQTQP